MTDTYDQFLEEDDEILASVLEDNNENINSIVDLCVSPKKCATVQSRLSHFFRKPASGNVCPTKTNNDAKNKSEQLCAEINSSECNNEGISNTPSIFHKGPDANGFHLLSGSHFVYPSNFPVRKYQMETIKTALFHNTLVSLPTGLGKTFIAAVVMYNFYRWYPMGKIIFMAPTRPLVAQQIEACHSIMGIPKDMTIEMTGNIAPEQRYLAWKKYRVFFLTPQVLANDLNLDKCPSETFRCIIVDEAHRATKDYAYVQVLKRLQEENRQIRIIGLTATPGSTTDSVIEVIQNLRISKLEFRTDESLDVAKYSNKKQVECLPVKLSYAILNIRTQFLEIYDKYSRRLKHYRALNGNVTNLTKFQIFSAKQKFMGSNLRRELPQQIVGCLINDFTICMSLAYALELLTVYGIKAFYLQSLELLETHKCLSNDADLQNILHKINNELNSQDLTWSHPKLFELKKIVQEYFCNTNTESNSKIIIFCQYRMVVLEVFELLKTFGSSVRPVMFVGQSLKKKNGLPQKKQLEVMSRFKSGDFNILIATSVAEEGLDIGEVDLIICLEANKSPIKFVQRLGRTGRKRSGKCITLLTENIEESKYKSSVSSSKTLVLKMLKNNAILSKLAPGGPRLIPKHITPQCLMIHVKQPDNNLADKKKVNTNICIKPNAKQHYECDEEGLDIFQHTKDKPSKKSKKQKTTAASKRIKSPAEDLNVEHNSKNNNFDIQGNNALAMNDKDFNGERNNDSDRFVDEEKAFNEWLESCEQTNSIVMNRPFFKLLNLFTEACSIVNDELDYKPLNLCNTDEELNKGKTDPNDILITIDDDDSKEITSYLNGEQELNKCVEGSSRSNNDSIQQRPPIVNKIDSATEHFFDVDVKNTYSEDLFKSQKSDKYISDRNDEEFVVELLNSDNLIRPIDQQQKSPVICSGRYLLNTTKTDKNKYSKKIDFNELFKSQKADKHIQDYTKEIPDSRKRQLFNDSNKLQSDVEAKDSSMHFDSDSSTEIVNIVERNGDNGDDANSEYDEAMGNVNFEDLFKSQRVDAYIKKYNDSIFVADHCVEDHNDAIGTIGALRKSPIVCSERHKSVSNLDCKSDNDILMGKSDQSIISIIDLVDDKNRENGENSVGFGHDYWWKSRRENKYVGDSNVETVVASGNVVTGDGGKQHIDSVVDDDVISLSSSPEFFSCKLPKKIIQTKILTNRVHPTDEIIDLSTPPSRSSDLVIGLSTANYYTLSPEKNKCAVSKDVGPRVDEGLSWNDEDDMDFMFVDYCSGTGSGGNTALSAKSERVSDSCNEVLTQNPRTDDDVGISDVFTQKHQVDVVNDSKTMINMSPKCRTSEEEIATGLMLTKPSRKDDATAKSVVPPLSYSNGVRSFDFMKTCNLFKPGFSLKRNTTSTVRRTTDDKLPINSPGWRHKPPNFSQSTPKVPTAAAMTTNTKQHGEIAEKVNVLFLTSSSDSDVFIEEKPTKSRQRIRKKRPPKPKKKLLFIDDEADVSNCGDTTAATATNNSSSSEDHDDDDNDVDFDSSFIDDEKSIPSTSMTKQYLQSVKSPVNTRGIFKIPMLSTQHYNINVYSQMADRNDNSYEEDSFCVKDVSDLNMSSNMNAHRKSEEQSPIRRKRKRIKSPLHSTDSDSDDHRTMVRKRTKPRFLDSS